MANLLDSVYRLFGRGKDNFTQTRIVHPRFSQLTKGESYVDCSYGNLYNLVVTTSELQAVISRFAAMYANGVYQHIRNGKVVENSKYVYALENPNPLMNGNEFMRSECTNYLIFGNSFIKPVKGLSGIPRQLFVVPSQYVKLNRTGRLFDQTDINGMIASYVFEMDGKVEDTFKGDELLHFKTTNPNDPLMGESKLISLQLEISNIRAAKGFRNRIITSNGALGFLSVDGTNNGMGAPLDDTEQKRLNAAYSQAFGMQEGKSDILMSEAPLKWTATTFPTKDLMLFEEVSADFKQIIDVIGLNENIFSFDKASKYSNLNEGIKSCYQDAIIPFAQDRDIAYTKMFGFDGIDEYIKTDYSHLTVLQNDKGLENAADKLKAETYAILAANGRLDLAGKLYE